MENSDCHIVSITIIIKTYYKCFIIKVAKLGSNCALKEPAIICVVLWWNWEKTHLTNEY